MCIKCLKKNIWIFWSYLADEFNVLPLNVFNHHDLHLIQEVKGQITQSISERAITNTVRTFDEMLYMTIVI